MPLKQWNAFYTPEERWFNIKKILINLIVNLTVNFYMTNQILSYDSDLLILKKRIIPWQVSIKNVIVKPLNDKSNVVKWYFSRCHEIIQNYSIVQEKWFKIISKLETDFSFNIFSKIFEKVIYTQLYSHMNDNNQLNSQYYILSSD